MAYTDYSAVQARNSTDLILFVNAAIADGWQPLGTPSPAGDGSMVQALVKGTPSGGGGSGSVSSSDITDASAVGIDVLTAIDASAARAAIGAGTSSIVAGAAVADATDEASAVTQLNALLASLRTSGALGT